MTKDNKLFEKIMAIPPRKNIKWAEIERLLLKSGFEKIEGSGSRIKFYHKKSDVLISIHKPHPGNELKVYQNQRDTEKIKRNRV